MQIQELAASPGYKIKWSLDFDEIKEEWTNYGEGESFFMDTEFMGALALCAPKRTQNVYIIIYEGQSAVGRIFGQLVSIQMSNSLRLDISKSKNPINKSATFLKNRITPLLKGNLLCMGHVLMSGSRGIQFKKSLELNDQKALLKNASDHMHREVNKSLGAMMVLIKDIKEELCFPEKHLEYCTFNPLSIPPAMCLDLDPEWKNMNDYMSSLKSKYRVRLRKAIKRCEPVRFEEMDEEDIEKNEEKIYSYYLNIAAKAGFNMCYLHESYFTILKKNLGDKMRLFGIFVEDNLIGFYSTIRGYFTLEAHFLGYDPELNRKHDLYLNILLRMLATSIDMGAGDLYLARTAQEIKSSIGAKPVYYFNYLKHKNKWINKVVPLFLNNLVPKEEFTVREPFKGK